MTSVVGSNRFLGSVRVERVSMADNDNIVCAMPATNLLNEMPLFGVGLKYVSLDITNDFTQRFMGGYYILSCVVSLSQVRLVHLNG